MRVGHGGRVEFALLGPLVVRRGETVIRVPTGKQRVLLAALLLAADQVLTIDELIDTMWDGRPPTSARITLQGHIKRLRRTLGDHTGSLIVTRPGGYTITTTGHELDITRFNELLAEGRQHAQQDRWQSVADTMHAALALWCGQPLLDVASQTLTQATLPRLTEMRLQAWGWRIEADLRLGLHERLIGELAELTTEYPLQERFHSQLMTALYRSGRQADALAAYHRLRQLLADELGVDPDPQSQQLFHQILVADPALLPAGPVVASAIPSPHPPAPPRMVRPAQLPADLTDFVGRESQTKHLADLLTDPGANGRRPLPVAAITGVGGIGKTSLAVRVAHRIADDFPDGQLYADLRGTGAQPQAAGDVLARFLRDLGVPDAAVPVDEEEQVVRYRSLLAGRRVLVLLDDARDTAQIRPLIPGAAGCAVLLTSRNRLSGPDGATVVDLDPLDTTEAGALFTGIVGPDRTTAEPGATTTVLAACDGFPLAIRIAATRLATRRGWNVRALADRLTDERDRLRELNVADLAIRVTFQTSYHALPTVAAPHGTDPARAFRLLGLAPGPSVSLPAAAVLFDTSVSHAEQALETLVDAHLLTSPEPGRYRFHDLLRVYAAERADVEEPEQIRTAAIHRLLTWYLDNAAAADQVLIPGPRRNAVDEGTPGLRFADYQEALRWFDIERDTLLAATSLAAETGEHDLAGRFAVRLRPFLGWRCHWDDVITVARIGLASARARGDRLGEADALNAMSTGFFHRNECQPAQDALHEALPIFRELGDLPGELAATSNLGSAYLWSGDVDSAAELMERAVAIARDPVNRPYEARALANLGYVCNELGQHERALACCERALTIASGADDPFYQGLACLVLGRAHRGLGRHTEAVEHLRRALELTEQVGAHELHGLALMYLGDVEDDLGHAQNAIRTWQQAHRVLDRGSHAFASQAADRLARFSS